MLYQPYGFSTTFQSAYPHPQPPELTTWGRRIMGASICIAWGRFRRCQTSETMGRFSTGLWLKIRWKPWKTRCKLLWKTFSILISKENSDPLLNVAMENPGTKYVFLAGKIKELNERSSIATIDYHRVNLEVNQCVFFSTVVNDDLPSCFTRYH